MSRAQETIDPVVIRPPSRWGMRQWGELWRYRDLIPTFAMRDLRVRYKQTALGVTWVVLQPLIAAGILSFVFGRVAKLEAPGGVPYFLFSLTGFISWTVFSGTLTKASNVLVAHAHLISKVYFPRITLPISTMFASLTDFGVGLALLLVVLPLMWTFPGSEIVYMPLSVIVLLLIALGLGFFTSALAVTYRDIRYLVPVASQFLLYASPVAYPAAEVPAEYQTIFYLNPMAGAIETFRWSLLGAGEPPMGPFLYSAIVGVSLFMLGSLFFHRVERSFADVI